MNVPIVPFAAWGIFSWWVGTLARLALPEEARRQDEARADERREIARQHARPAVAGRRRRAKKAARRSGGL